MSHRKNWNFVAATKTIREIVCLTERIQTLLQLLKLIEKFSLTMSHRKNSNFVAITKTNREILTMSHRKNSNFVATTKTNREILTDYVSQKEFKLCCNY